MNLKYELLIAFRFFKIKKTNYFISRISSIGIIIISLAIIIPMVTVSIMNGLKESISEKHINKDFHIQITQQNKLSNFQNLSNKIMSIKEIQKEIQGIYPFYESQILIKFQNSPYFPVLLRGIDSKFYVHDSSFKKHFPLIAGKIEINKKFHIAIGDKLVKHLNPDYKNYQNFMNQIKTKNYPIINIVVISNNNYQKNKLFVQKQVIIKQMLVSGVFKSGYLEYDKYFTFTILKSNHSIFNAKIYESGQKKLLATGIGIKLHSRKNIKFILKILTQKFNNYIIYSWEKANNHLIYALKWEGTLIRIILIIMILASVIITIYINLNIIVIDKKKEIGILKTFGVKNSSIHRIFLIEGLLIGIIGTFFGALISLIIIFFLKEIIFITEIVINKILFLINKGISNKIYINWEFFSGDFAHLKSSLYKLEFFDLFILCTLSIFISMLASYFPSRKSTSEKITDVIRYE